MSGTYFGFSRDSLMRYRDETLLTKKDLEELMLGIVEQFKSTENALKACGDSYDSLEDRIKVRLDKITERQAEVLKDTDDIVKAFGRVLDLQVQYNRNKYKL